MIIIYCIMKWNFTNIILEIFKHWKEKMTKDYLIYKKTIKYITNILWKILNILKHELITSFSHEITRNDLSAN